MTLPFTDLEPALPRIPKDAPEAEELDPLFACFDADDACATCKRKVPRYLQERGEPEDTDDSGTMLLPGGWTLDIEGDLRCRRCSRGLFEEGE